MEELDLFKKLNKVKAPPDFEKGVLTLLSTRKETKRLRKRYFRLSFAGAFAILLAFFVSLNVFVLHKKAPLGVAESEKGLPSYIQRESPIRTRDYIPLIETVDYSKQIRRLSYEPDVIYILENISESHIEKIKY